MPIDSETKAQFIQRASVWMDNTNPKFFNWAFGDVQSVKGAFYNKEKGHAERVPDGLVVPILCGNCGSTIAHYDELPDSP